MTWKSRFLSCFPALHAALVLGLLFAAAFLNVGIIGKTGLVFLACFALYLLPPLLYRLHNIVYSLREGMTCISSSEYSSWWGGHQIQGLFTTFPAIESALRLLPGVYSAWLRLWGAKVGRGVYWTPQVEICDRGLVDIGDKVLFGHQAVMCSHVVVPRKQKLYVYVKSVRVESAVFVGARASIGPGCVAPAGSFLPYRCEMKVNETFSATQNVPAAIARAL